MRLDCLSEMVAAIGPAPEDAMDWMGQVFDAYIHDLENVTAASPSRQLLSVLDGALDQAMQVNCDILPWQDAISILRRKTLPFLPRSERAEVEALLSQARVVVVEAMQRCHAYRQWQANREAEKLRNTNRALLTTFDIQQLGDVLVERLPGLGIPSVYLAMYEPDVSDEVPEQARLVLAYTDGKRAALEPGGRLFSSCQLVPPDLLPRHRRYSLVAEPLYFQEKSLGYVVFEIGPYDGNVYELLRNNLSSALQGALLFQESQQARLAAEKADRIKTRLLANVSHEMRTPLNIILGYTRDALQEPNKYGEELPSPLLGDIRQIQSNAEHQLRVINDLLDLSRAEIEELDLSLELLDPNQLLLDAFHSFADQSASPDVRWKLDIPERLPQIRADPIRLRQVFLNLLSNAKKYTEQGEITLGAEVAPPHVQLWVLDTGSGIHPQQQERIFEPFVSMEDNRGRRRIGQAIDHAPPGGVA
jgi:signal transduction histidine kinase